MLEVMKTLVGRAKFLDSLDEALVCGVVEWYLRAKQVLFDYALKEKLVKLRKVRGILKSLGLPKAVRSSLYDELRAQVEGEVRALLTRRSKWRKVFADWWNGVLKVCDEYGIERDKISGWDELKGLVEKVLEIVKGIDDFDVSWDGELQDLHSALKKVWGEFKRLCYEAVTKKMKEETGKGYLPSGFVLSNPLKPPEKPTFRAFQLPFGARVSGNKKINNVEVLSIEPVYSRDGRDRVVGMMLDVKLKGNRKDAVKVLVKFRDRDRLRMLMGENGEFVYPKQAKLRKVKRKGKEYWEIHLTVKKFVEGNGCEYICGIDYGQRNLVACVVIPVNGEKKGSVFLIRGGEFWERVNRAFKYYSTLQRENKIVKKRFFWRKLKRHAKLRRDLSNLFAYMLANKLLNFVMGRYGNSVYFALEDLTGLKKGRLNKKMRRKMSKWAVRKFQNILSQKAAWHGYKVVYVKPAFTSTICPRCGFICGENRKENGFCCVSCGFSQNADVVGAFNIAVRAAKMLKLSLLSSTWKVLSCRNEKVLL